jgi:hypothetical protein
MATREEAMLEWRRWVEQEIGGSPEKTGACAQAAIAALDLNKRTDEVIAAARNAAARWDSEHPQPAPKQYRARKAFLIFVVAFLTLMILGNEFGHGHTGLGVMTLIAILTAILLVRIIRKH